jgi:Leucine-rich repeat (LRR) protein
MEDRLVAAQKRVRLGGHSTAGESVPTKRRLARIPTLQDLCLSVMLPEIVARGDRYLMKNMGADLAMLVFQRLKRDRALNANTMKLFLHTNLPRVDLSDYGNTTREFLESIAHMAVTLTSLSLADCPLVSDFERLQGMHRLTVLDLNGCQFRDKHLVHVKGLTELVVLRLARTNVTTAALNVALRWFPALVELDLSRLDLTDGCLGALRSLTALQSLQLAANNFEVLRLNPLKRLLVLNVADCNGLVNETLYWLAGCKALVQLDLARASRLTGKGLYHLRSLTRLESLQLPPSAVVEPEAFAFLRPLQLLRALALPRYDVRDISFLQDMPHLQNVNLAACPIADLRPLAAKPDLTVLNLQGTVVVFKKSLHAFFFLGYIYVYIYMYVYIYI